MKDFGKLLSSGDPNQLTASFFEDMARDNFKDFLGFFRKDYHEKIDFTKDCEIGRASCRERVLQVV